MRKFSKSKTYRTMINYSIVKRSVNANLIEINQAKSRINQAKKEGKTPQPADLAAILYLTVDCMREQLLEGKKIRLGDLGDFSVSLSSKGVEDPNAFNAQNITGVKVIWEPGAEFNLVASRDAQAAVIKAIKQGRHQQACLSIYWRQHRRRRFSDWRWWLSDWRLHRQYPGWRRLSDRRRRYW